MPRTITTTVYEFEELDDDAKQNAIESHNLARAGEGSPWEHEWRDTLNTAIQALDLEHRNWYLETESLTPRDRAVGELEGVRAWKWLHNNDVPEVIGEIGSCPFTGYCGDESFLEPLRTFLRRPEAGTDLDQLFRECLQSWARDWEADDEYQRSEEVVSGLLVDECVEFTKDGERV